MASKKRNALAELANALVAIGIKCDDENAAVRISQAQRIIAELAKITLNGVGWPVRLELADAYEKCRAIAEEGAKE